MPPRKRRHNEDDDDDDEENSLDAENGLRSKRKAAVAARAKVVQDKDSDEEEDEDSEEEEEDDDEQDEDFNEDEDEDEEEGEESKDGAEGGEDEDENEEEDEDEDVDADAIKVECIEAVLEEPTKELAGYVLKAKEGKTQKLEMWFSEEMSETVGDISEAFNFEGQKLPVLQVTKFDVIEEREDIYQIDVLEVKFDKTYAVREKENEDDDSNLAHSLHCLVRVDGKKSVWATQYFMPEEDDE